MFTTKIHSLSSSFCLLLSTSVQSPLEPFISGSLLPLSSFLHIESTQSRFAPSKLPQPWVDLIHIAATPAIRRRRVGTAHWEACILALAVAVRNCLS